MTINAVIHETIKPVANIPISYAVNEWALWMRSKPVAAAIVGTASKKENSTAFFRDRPIVMPPTIEAADRETPGIMEHD